MPTPVLPPPLHPGDRVAVVSPSWAAPAHFPTVHEQALRRLRDVIGVEPVEFPTTRRDATPAERAADLNAAFADPGIRAVLSTIGGDDQITVLKHLDAEVIRAHPKRFLGYSDNTNLLNYLWFHGIAAVHGGSTQVHLGPVPDDAHLESLRAALFGGAVELAPQQRTRDVGLRWDDPRALTDAAPDLPAEPWTWSGPARRVTGPTWGGCLEIVEWTLAADRWMRPVSSYEGMVLLLEAHEEPKTPTENYRMLRNLGERGLLGAASALLWGRPPVGDHEHQVSVDDASAIRAEQRDAVLRAVDEYAPDLVVALDVDYGHTCPQLLLPYGGKVTVDGESRTITAHFG
ncbi:S66 peptidase family protein [Flexivirga oryzae]|uniref:Muramoyltetrapeptide carboxypeptidase LdcA involved in peptidoglycan recycling n=1 Tax=Flexivirga oryzae TaxID=1794944 RepID=A0A839NDZ9_9MICO|nr:S66 peptidase family protein [Flexivirga oryzae]MBB2894543.1 muramoyltetrapeptide carboxypeptidase LdcA involved in peptidoglycan recycling [Flexivirga oryzae]